MDKSGFDKIVGKTTVEAMELNRDEDWVRTTLTEGRDWINSNLELITLITSNLLDERHPDMNHLLMGTSLAVPVTELVALFLKLGWMKCKQVEEDKAKLDKIWRE